LTICVKDQNDTPVTGIALNGDVAYLADHTTLMQIVSTHKNSEELPQIHVHKE